MNVDDLADQLDELFRSPRGRNLARLIARRANETEDPGDVRELVAAVAAESGIDAKLLMGRTRVRTVSAVRHLVWLLARDEFGLPYQRLAAAFARDHSSVISGCTRALERLEFDVELTDLRRRSLDRFRNPPQPAEIGAPECET